MLKYLVLLFLLIIPLYLAPHSILAQQYQTQYKTDYYIQSDDSSKVETTISFLNLSTDIFIQKFGLTFPSSFSINNVKSMSGTNTLPVTVNNDGTDYQVQIAFPNPSDISQRDNSFTITYDQQNLFQRSGNVIEVILPTLGDQDNADSTITVHLPDNFNRKINLAKPVPTSIHNNIITWEHVKTKTIYAVFGDSQLYNLNLTYHLKNTDNNPVYTDIAFPPETQYQHIIVNSITPKPSLIYTDSDGNYLGRYNLLIGQSVDVDFKGTAEIFTEPQSDMIAIQNNQMQSIKSYLLTPQKYWDLGNKADQSDIESLKTPVDIFNYDINKLSYNYARVTSSIKRLGASTILATPNQAVCMEFTDLFVAIAREKGIYAREIEGYGYSDDQKLRPLSLVTDVLHSWPEYYDTSKDQWIPVDPTWANTSGIDYFNSLDLNHIVFAIHGKDSSIPYPAGTYKTSNSKDVIVQVTENKPKENTNNEITTDIKNSIIINKTYKGTITIHNIGNVFIKNAMIEVQPSAVSLDKQKFYVDLLPPDGSKTYSFQYHSSTLTKQGYITVLFQNKVVKTIPMKVTSSFEAMYVKILLSLIGASILIGLFLAIKRRDD